MFCILIWRRTKTSLSLISDRWSHNPLGRRPSCSGYYYSTPWLLLHGAGSQILRQILITNVSNVLRNHLYPIPSPVSLTKSEFRLSINQSVRQLPFLSTFLLFLPSFSCTSFNQGFLGPASVSLSIGEGPRSQCSPGPVRPCMFQRGHRSFLSFPPSPSFFPSKRFIWRNREWKTWEVGETIERERWGRACCLG